MQDITYTNHRMDKFRGEVPVYFFSKSIDVHIYNVGPGIK